MDRTKRLAGLIHDGGHAMSCASKHSHTLAITMAKRQKDIEDQLGNDQNTEEDSVESDTEIG